MFFSMADLCGLLKAFAKLTLAGMLDGRVYSVSHRQADIRSQPDIQYILETSIVNY